MFHKHDISPLTLGELAELGTDAVAYMRQMTTSEILSAFPAVENLDPDTNYWALFAANGAPLMISTSAEDITASAFYGDIEAVQPN